MSLPFEEATLQETLFFVPEIANETNGVASSIRYEGENLKQVALIYKPLKTDDLPEENMQSLMRLISLMKLELKDVTLVNLKLNPKIHFRQLITELSPAVILFFGVVPDEIKLRVQVEFFRINKIGNIQTLFSPFFEQLDGKSKNILLSQLKIMFNL